MFLLAAKSSPASLRISPLLRVINFMALLQAGLSRGALGFSFAGKPRCRGFKLAIALHSSTSSDDQINLSDDVALYRAEGIFSVVKPLEWTSSDVVSYIRGLLEGDTRRRGGTTTKVTSRKNKSRIIRAGHGGTLDPLATGVLVVGIGKGTKELQSYLSGSKKYFARGEFGFETTTLDMSPSGNVTKRMPTDHITVDAVQKCLPLFTGDIQQIPPIFSAIKKNGKKLYEAGREGKTAEDLEIESRKVTVYKLELVDATLPSFDINIECGGGTYIRSLIRDIGYKLDSVATMTHLTRTQQAQFSLEDALTKDDWTADNIYAAINRVNEQRRVESTELRYGTLLIQVLVGV